MLRHATLTGRMVPAGRRRGENLMGVVTDFPHFYPTVLSDLTTMRGRLRIAVHIKRVTSSVRVPGARRERERAS